MHNGELQGPRGLGGGHARGRDVQLLPHVLGGRQGDPGAKAMRINGAAILLMGKLDMALWRRTQQHPGRGGQQAVVKLATIIVIIGFLLHSCLHFFNCY